MNNLMILKKENLKTKAINKVLSTSKGLINNENYTNYLYVQALYRKAFEKFLLSKIDLEKYEKEIIESNLDFGIVPKDERNNFHKTSYLNLNYIYVRNLFFVEKLESNNIKIFYERLNNKNYEVDDELIKIVKETYNEIINDNYRHGNYKEETTTCYGSCIPSNIVDSKALVLAIQYGKNGKEYTNQMFIENMMKQDKLLMEIRNKIEDEVSSKLDIETKVLIKRSSEE